MDVSRFFNYGIILSVNYTLLLVNLNYSLIFVYSLRIDSLQMQKEWLKIDFLFSNQHKIYIKKVIELNVRFHAVCS